MGWKFYLDFRPYKARHLNAEESLHGVNPLPIDSPVLVVESTDFVRPASLPEGGGEVTGRGASTPIETSRGNITADERPLLEAATASELVGLGSRLDVDVLQHTQNAHDL